MMDLDDASYEKSRKGQGKRKQVAGKSNNREFAVITYFFLALFICMAGYFIYFITVRSEDFINNSYNARLSTLSNYVTRGRILSADGEVLAQSFTLEDGTEIREYPYGATFAHAVGYSVNGMAGVELDGNFNLLRSNSFILERVIKEIKGEKNQGDDVVTTLDVPLQQAAYQGMGQYNGAVIALEPSTGKVLAMVSKPDYDPNTVAADWDQLISGDSTALLNRATQGLYPPGSTFKIVTALSYLEQNENYGSYTFDCSGSYEVSGYEIHCYHNKAHGQENLLQAFGNSCNNAFANVGLLLNPKKYISLTDQLLFNQPLPTKLSNVKSSSFTLTENSSSAEIMQTAIGQGNTLVTPLHMAMIAGAVANGGELMEPYMIDHSQNDQQEVVKQFYPESYGTIMSSDEAAVMEEFMRYVVTDGTASALNTDRYTVYGKTGTAEYNSNKNDNHSWFVGYARDAYGKEIAIAIIMEGAGSGSSHAVPLAKKCLEAYYR